MKIIQQNLSYFFIFISLILSLIVVTKLSKTTKIVSPVASSPYWSVRSIDTMKYSRDPSREKLTDSAFDIVIAQQVKEIALTGASHVAIATPYDEEFLPILKKWVKAARENHLKVWFRGNFSGWEGWFNYPKISRETHKKMVEGFIKNNSGLFENGDIFTACPECENGGPGDPRTNGDVEGHRQFLIDEYQITKATFDSINKTVISNFDSMNGDVAREVMDKETTQKLDGVVVVDHYVETPEQLDSDLTQIAINSGGKVVLGEFGAPIPDLQGKMTEKEQADWIQKALILLSQNKNVIGLNYWVGTGGSTELWDEANNPHQAVNIIRQYYSKK